MASRPQRKDYTTQTSFDFKRPNNSLVTFSFDFDPARPYATRLTLPPGSKWSPEPHWHERYTEYICCVSGRLLIRLDGVDKVVTPADGPQTVNKYVVHEFMRADAFGYANANAEGEDEDVMVDEWTDPADGVKHVFFRNLLGVLQDQEYFGKWFGPQALLVCSRYDNYNVLWGGWGRWAVTHGMFALVEAVAVVVGLKPWYAEYTPERLRAAAEGAQKKSV
ncbi:uncharacterized protein HMPREF1541_01113 [Cyphellophora europaea CBS 101466]|uniref:Cupin 2 conserved barrel domain-containing protein n=1 Tax=Cyphellophora europaea (strain CBS 101466) TaxID=1220924 RepID=W2SGC9_CYPE1|nr:uncharacterized protein HMPREF1541_01113 [Cyphellophora europaea CBS 101466]ETN46924.1 hypothetical protein HMPREF1541_01113 [Cyphellophora europaea CBS 101466]